MEEGGRSDLSQTRHPDRTTRRKRDEGRESVQRELQRTTPQRNPNSKSSSKDRAMRTPCPRRPAHPPLLRRLHKAPVAAVCSRRLFSPHTRDCRLEPRVAGSDKLLLSPALQKIQLFGYFLKVPIGLTTTSIPQRTGVEPLGHDVICCYTGQQQSSTTHAHTAAKCSEERDICLRTRSAGDGFPGERGSVVHSTSRGCWRCPPHLSSCHPALPRHPCQPASRRGRGPAAWLVL